MNQKIAIREYILELSKKIPIQKAILFGSYANGSFTKDSDVDLAIFLDYFEETSRIDGIKFLLSRARKYVKMDLALGPEFDTQKNQVGSLRSEFDSRRIKIGSLRSDFDS
jgi:predicted nucleotidyltransferase